MEGKPVSASVIIDQVIEVFPNDLNAHGTLFGGRLMQVVDSLAAIVAKRHTGRVCVTLGIDSVRFLNPARHGDILVCKASVNRTWRTSMEIGVKVIAEDFRTLEQKDILSAYFTFVAMDDELKPFTSAFPPPTDSSFEGIKGFRTEFEAASEAEPTESNTWLKF